MDEVKVTWGLVWAIWWRFTLISLGISCVIGAIIVLVAYALGTSYLPW
jgi:hypothetical protein